MFCVRGWITWCVLHGGGGSRGVLCVRGWITWCVLCKRVDHVVCFV